MKTKRIITYLASAFFMLCMLFALLPNCKEATAATPSVAECVVEATSKRFLHERNAECNLPMASTTKVLTAIVILDDCDITESVTVPKEAEGTEGSSVYLRAGDVYTVEELLYGLMLRSGNDCAVTLALHHSGSIEAFAQAMNRKAERLGAEHSRFVNPHGLPDKRHYTTAQDLALIAEYALQNETFREIVSCKFYEKRNWKNKNKMLWEYEGAIGVKTGFTLSAGRCLVTAAERNGMRLVCVVLDSPQMFERTAELLDCAFSAYELTQLCAKEAGCEGYSIEYSFSYPLTAEEKKQVEIKTELLSPVPDSEGEIAGQMKILLANHLLFSQNLYIMKK